MNDVLIMLDYTTVRIRKASLEKINKMTEFVKNGRSEASVTYLEHIDLF